MTDLLRTLLRLAVTTAKLCGPGSVRAVMAENLLLKNVGVTQVGERIWLVSFMQNDLGYFDDETCRLEPIANQFGPKVLPMSPE